MICNKYRKEDENGINHYYPVLEDYIHSEQFERERGEFVFEVPKEIKCKKALPILDLRKAVNYTPSSTGMLAFYLFQFYMSNVDKSYPEIICTKLERGKYLKYQFKYFYTYSFMNIPFFILFIKSPIYIPITPIHFTISFNMGMTYYHSICL